MRTARREPPEPPGGGVDQTTDEAPDADPYAVARMIALRQLTTAPRTRAQLADSLRRRNVPDDVAAAVMDRLVEVKLIDDEAFAEMWVRSRHNGRGLARRALAHELRHRGVDDDVVAQAVDSLDPDVELETARALVERRLGSTTGLDADRRARRLAGMLARKGYPPGVALRLVRDALATER